MVKFCPIHAKIDLRDPENSVRLGKSGLKVSRIILGCMSYGTPEWQPWVLGEDEGIAQIKFACVIQSSNWARLFDFRVQFGAFSYENGVQTFDTANVSPPPPPHWHQL